LHPLCDFSDQPALLILYIHAPHRRGSGILATAAVQLPARVATAASEGNTLVGKNNFAHAIPKIQC